MPSRTSCLTALLATLLLSGAACAQSNAFGGFGGSFLGLVIDAQSRRTLADVTVTAYGTDLPTKTGKTTADGNYGILALPYGTYTLTFDKDGYRRFVSTGNEVIAGRNIVEVDAGLQLKAADNP